MQILENVLAQNGSYEPVAPGWKLTERQTLQTMLIPSANNYAESLAISRAGGAGTLASTAPINPQGTTQVSVNVRPGTYTIAVWSSLASDGIQQIMKFANIQIGTKDVETASVSRENCARQRSQKQVSGRLGRACSQLAWL